MLTLAEAHHLVAEHLGASSRARHSFFVGHVMKRIASLLGDDAVLWELVGICHDLDFQATETQRDQHGMVTVRWLAGELPAEALEAIKAHDHRTGVISETSMASALKLADASAIIVDRMGGRAIATLRLVHPWPAFTQEFSDRPYLTEIVRSNCKRLGVKPSELAKLIEGAPPSS